ncbi:MAG: hypothetical protein EXR67_06445 [Dehalococcoidia bacterium]|nr:hypothetical protein [Dehalococcoidia bacterium]
MTRYVELLAAPPARAKTFAVLPGSIPPDAAAALDSLPAISRDAAKKLLERSTTGAYLLAGSAATHVIAPPFPIPQAGAWDGWHLEPLRRSLAARPFIGVALIRLNGYALAVFDGDTLAASKVSGSNVHGKNSNGGWSQARFARRRVKQVRELYDRIEDAVQEHFTPFENKLTYVFLGGDRITLKQFLDRCAWFSKKFGSRILPRTLHAEEANREALESVLFKEVWKFQVLPL